MKRIAGLILFVIIVTLPYNAEAQRWKLRRYEATVGLTAASYYGDVGASSANPLLGIKTVMLGSTRPILTLGARYKITGNTAVKLNLSGGWLNGKDGGDLGEYRDYSLNMTIFEPSVQFEYYLMGEGRSFSSAALFNRRGMLNNYSKVYLYAFGGVGGTFFWPKEKTSTIIQHREFQEFKKFALVLPIGLGLKYSISPALSVGFEYGPRFTFTDKIDGMYHEYSQYNDRYDFATFSAMYKVRTDRRGRPMFRYGFRR